METTSRGHRIHYESWGSGPALVLVCGSLQSLDHWHEAGIPQHFAASHRVIALDPLGHGRSDKPHMANAYHEGDLPADVLAVLDAEGLDRAVLWGYSRGSRISYLTAAAEPGRVSALVAGGAVPWRAGEAAPRYAGLAAALRRSPNEFFDAIGVADVAARHYLIEHNDLDAVVAALEGSAEAPADIDLAEVQCPTFVYFGSLEPWADRARGDAARIGARLHVVEGKDHGGTFLAGPEVIPLVDAFLREVHT